MVRDPRLCGRWDGQGDTRMRLSNTMSCLHQDPVAARRVIVGSRGRGTPLLAAQSLRLPQSWLDAASKASLTEPGSRGPGGSLPATGNEVLSPELRTLLRLPQGVPALTAVAGTRLLRPAPGSVQQGVQTRGLSVSPGLCAAPRAIGRVPRAHSQSADGRGVFRWSRASTHPGRR